MLNDKLRTKMIKFELQGEQTETTSHPAIPTSADGFKVMMLRASMFS